MFTIGEEYIVQTAPFWYEKLCLKDIKRNSSSYLTFFTPSGVDLDLTVEEVVERVRVDMDTKATCVHGKPLIVGLWYKVPAFSEVPMILTNIYPPFTNPTYVRNYFLLEFNNSTCVALRLGANVTPVCESCKFDDFKRYYTKYCYCRLLGEDPSFFDALRHKERELLVGGLSI